MKTKSTFKVRMFATFRSIETSRVQALGAHNYTLRTMIHSCCSCSSRLEFQSNSCFFFLRRDHFEQVPPQRPQPPCAFLHPGLESTQHHEAARRAASASAAVFEPVRSNTSSRSS